MTARARRTFPLLPRRPLVGNPFGYVRSARRGPGTDVVGSKPYVPGDRLATIDWHASARLSAASGSDEFLVRQTLSEDAPRVVVVCDRRPPMALYPPGLPFVSKRDAIRECVTAIAASARAARAPLGWCDVGARGETWLAPHLSLASVTVERRLGEAWDADTDSLERAVSAVVRRRTEAPPGTFVFVVSDFLEPPPRRFWQVALGRGLDIVPVVVNDPVWESSFPDVAGVVLGIQDPRNGRRVGVRLTREETRNRRAENIRRALQLRELFRQLNMDAVRIESSSPVDVDVAFAEWAARRRRLRRTLVRA